MEQFDFETLENAHLECEECGCSGKGYETEKGYNSLPGVIELFCPVCKHFFGEIKRENTDQPETNKEPL